MIADVQTDQRPARKQQTRRGFLDGTLSSLVKRAVIVQTVLILAVLWSYAAWRLNIDREHTLEAGRQQLRSSAAALHVHFQAILNNGLGAALAGTNEVNTRGGISQLSDTQLSELLNRQLTGGEYVRALFLSTPHRFVSMTRGNQMRTQEAPPEWLQPAFLANAGDSYTGSIVREPAAPADPVLPVAVRVKSISGETMWAGALIGMQSLNDLYQGMAIDNGMLALLSGSGQRLLRVPLQPASERRRDASQARMLFRRAVNLREDEGFVSGNSPYTGKPWIYAMRRFPDSRMMAVAARSEESILEPWRDRSFAIVPALLIISLLVIFLAALLKHFVERLERRDSHYRILFNNSAVSVFMMSGDTFLEANTTTYRMFRVPESLPFEGVHPWDISPLRQPDGRESMTLAREHIQTAQALGQFTFRWTHKRMDTQEPFNTEVSLSSMQIGDSSLMLAIVRDVTELERTQLQLQAANADLEQVNAKLAALNTDLENRVVDRTAAWQEANLRLAMTNQELEAFAASASHDLRSPLITIAGQAGLLEEELQPQMNDAIRQRIDRIMGGVKRSSEIVEGLLSLAKLARQHLLSQPVDMTVLASAIVDELRQQYPAHAVDCTICEAVKLQADPRLIKSLLSNLLGNAWKYTSKRTAARVSLQCSFEEGTPVFSVSDNGAGFDMAHAQSLFQPFQRMHSAAEFPGIGIGLATVARIVQRYGGRIWVQSQPGRGTTFFFTLPVATGSFEHRVRQPETL
jgi:signal transduction histidine kinase